MTDYTKLVDALRYCGKKYFTGDECENCILFGTGPLCSDKLKLDAAAAIEALEAEVESMDESCKIQLVAMARHNAELQAEVERLKADVDAAYRH